MDLNSAFGRQMARLMAGRSGQIPQLLYINSENRGIGLVKRISGHSDEICEWVEKVYTIDTHVSLVLLIFMYQSTCIKYHIT